MIFDSKLRAEYQRLWCSMVITVERRSVDLVVRRCIDHRERYERAAAPSGTPWGVVACIHALESGSQFDRHLHNGDPLIARTVNVPAGRPPGDPPFGWEESATDALAYAGMDGISDWSIPAAFYCLERWNGWGYRRHHPEVLTPYLWAGSNHYTRGKYVADGRFDSDAVSHQIGAAVIIRGLSEVCDLWTESTQPGLPLLRWSAGPVRFARGLQEFLRGLPGLGDLVVDGRPGDRTSDAFRVATGRYLPGDPRGARE
jgi:lysozyme family protein